MADDNMPENNSEGTPINISGDPLADPALPHLVLNICKWLVFYYLLIFLPSFIIEESRFLLGPDYVYIYHDIHRSIYHIGPQQAAYGVNNLDNYPDQIFIVGGSTAARAYRPQTLMKDLPGYKVHNLCLDGPNVTEMKQLVDLIDSGVDIRRLHSSIFVFPVVFATFLNNEREYNFGDATPSIEEEQLRHHLYKRSHGQVVPALPEPLMKTAFILVRPFIWLYSLEMDLNSGLSKVSWQLSALLSQQPKIEQGQGGFNKAFWLGKFEHRGFTDDQFKEFVDLVNRLSSMGANIVVIDLPLPSYLRNDFFIYDDYRKRMQPIIKNPALHYLDLTSWAPDGQFADDVHPKPEFYDSWTAEMSRYLRTVINRPHVTP